MKSCRPFVAITALCWLYSAPFAEAQIDLSGTLDIGYKQDFGADAGERSSQINSSLKGLSPFSLVRSRIFADAEVSEDVTAFTTILFDQGLEHFDLEGAYLIFNRVSGRESVNLLAGKMATAFGTFASRSFGTLNPLIGTPLLYQYFSSVHGSRVPADAAAQLSQRDGPSYRARGLPTIYDACWNTGLQVFGSTSALTYAVAVTKGALSNPAASDNDGAQFVGRLGIQPTMGWKLGLSGAYGPYLRAAAAEDADFPVEKSVEDFNQLAIGIDAEYAVWHCEFVFELVRNQWDVPNVGDALSLTGGYVEGTIAVAPRLRYSLRLGSMVYGEIDDGNGGKQTWDYDIRRAETGFEYYIDQNVRAKTVLQLNFRDDPAPGDDDHMIGFQLATVF